GAQVAGTSDLQRQVRTVGLVDEIRWRPRPAAAYNSRSLIDGERDSHMTANHRAALQARPMNEVASVSDHSSFLDRLRQNIGSVFLGKAEVVDLAVVTLLAEGHLLIEDVPGIGKTLLAKAMSRSLACSFHRIQFTPDLLPSDLIGTSVYQQSSGTFVFQPGPLFASVILADEINRATPRTQSALLE